MVEIDENYDYEDDSQKKGSINNIKNYYILAALLVSFIILFSLFFYSSSNNTVDETKSFLLCGDGTFSSECSLNSPYYCEGKDLVPESELCGCPDSLNKINNECVSKYFTEEKDVTLNYVLMGEAGEINMKVYGGVSEYLDTKERAIIYDKGEIPSRADFKFIKIDDEIQREALMGLVVSIQNIAPNSLTDQARVAISLVQNIPYKESEFGKVGNFRVNDMRLARYPYQVIETEVGSCEGKSELLVFLLREIGYGTAVFYYNDKNHEAVGVKCPIEESLDGTGYCFVETTVPAPISYSTGNYLIGESTNVKLENPRTVILSKGISLESGLIEYADVEKIEDVFKNGRTDIYERSVKLSPIYEKYGMQ